MINLKLKPNLNPSVVAAAVLLGLNTPALLFAGTLYQAAECRVTEQDGQRYAIPIGRRSDGWGFLLLLALGSAVGAAALLFERKQLEALVDESRQLPASTAQPLDLQPKQPVPMQAELERVPVRARIETPQVNVAAVVPELSGANIPAADLEALAQQLQGMQAQSSDTVVRKDALKRAAATNLSIAFCGPSGTGKTTSMLCWEAHIFEQYPDAIVRVLTFKADSFLGLDQIPGMVRQYSLGMAAEDLAPVFQELQFASAVMEYRSKKSQAERKHFREKQPYYLFLDDYFSLQNWLKECANLPQFKGAINLLRSMLGSIITNGRESGVMVAFGTQSFNVSDLPVSGSGIRSCMSIWCQGMISEDQATGRKEGGFDAILLAIRNQYVVTDKTVALDLRSQFAELQQVSDQLGQPMYFSTMAHPGEMGILPNNRWVHEYRLPQQQIARIMQNEIALRKTLDKVSDMPVSTTSGTISEGFSLASVDDESRLKEAIDRTGVPMKTLTHPEIDDIDSEFASLQGLNQNDPDQPELTTEYDRKVSRLSKAGLTSDQITYVVEWDYLEPNIEDINWKMVKDRVRLCNLIELTQDRAVLAIFGKSPGGEKGSPYRRAVEIYKTANQALKGDN